jgi:hypothetical protein
VRLTRCLEAEHLPSIAEERARSRSTSYCKHVETCDQSHTNPAVAPLLGSLTLL